MTQQAKYRVGMIGIGRKGSQHARAYRLNPRVEIVAATDTDEENLDMFCKRFNVRGYTDYKEMLAKENLDIAAPILPVRPNAGVVIGCAEAGVKGIMCEKPVAATLADADRMVAVCKAKGVKFGAGDLNMNLPAYQTAKAMIDAGEIGPVRSIHWYGGSGNELSGGGIQQFSITRMFAGWDEVAWAVGWVAEDPWSDYDQGGAGYFRFVNGVEAFFHRETDGRGRGFEVACANGVLRVTDEVFHMYKAPEGKSGSWENLVEIKGVFPEGNVMGRLSSTYDDDGWKWPGDRNKASVDLFIASLDKGMDPPGSGDNGRKVLEMAIGLRESHRAGHAPVRFPLADRNLRMVPRTSRMDYKKEQIGRDAYMKQMRSHVKDGG